MRSRLFDFVQNPFSLQFDSDFMKLVPETPGVYKMKNQEHEIVYVGKAKNLRARLNSYRHLERSPDVSRKNLRLLRAVKFLEWEELPTETAALIRESHLIQELKPLFNVLRPVPEAYTLIFLKSSRCRTKLSIHWEPFFEANFEGAQHVFGAFRGRSWVGKVLLSLERARWLAETPPTHALDFPTRLRGYRLLPRTPLEWPREEQSKLISFFRGTNRKLLQHLTAKCEHLSGFWKTVAREQLEILEMFWKQGTRRNRLIIKKGFAEAYSSAQPDVIDPYVLDASIFEYEGARRANP